MKKPSRTHVKQSSMPETRKRRATALTNQPYENQRHAPAKNRGSTPVSQVVEDNPGMALSNKDPLPNLQVKVIKTDQGLQAYLFEANRKRLAIPSDLFLQDRTKAQRLIQETLGINLVPAAARRALDKLINEAKPANNVLAVSGPGFDHREGCSDRPEYYAYGDGDIITIPEAVDCVTAFPTNSKFQCRGEADQYNSTIAGIVREQAVPLLVLFFGLAPILLRYCQQAGLMVENAFLELTGPSSTNKLTCPR